MVRVVVMVVAMVVIVRALTVIVVATGMVVIVVVVRVIVLGEKSGSISSFAFRLKPRRSKISLMSASPKFTTLIAAFGFMCIRRCLRPATVWSSTGPTS